MNGWDIAILLLIALLLTAAVICTVRRRRKGKGCCGDCAGCSFRDGCQNNKKT